MKERRLYLYENVGIHLDAVDGSGTFLELEAVLSSPGGAAATEELAALDRVAAALDLDERETIAGSYLDLLAHAPTRPKSTTHATSPTA